jgi:hypothetical protein
MTGFGRAGAIKAWICDHFGQLSVGGRHATVFEIFMGFAHKLTQVCLLHKCANALQAYNH